MLLSLETCSTPLTKLDLLTMCLHSRSHACTSHTTEQHQNFPMQQNIGPYMCSRAEMSDQPFPQTSVRRVCNRAGEAYVFQSRSASTLSRRGVMLLFTEGESNRGGRLRAGHVWRERSSSEGFSVRLRTDGELRVHLPSIIPRFCVPKRHAL